MVSMNTCLGCFNIQSFQKEKRAWYIYIYVIRDFSGISAWVWEFYSTFRLSFWSHFQERGWLVYVVLASLSRVRFGECLLSEFLQSEYLVGWEFQEVWGILRLRVEYLQLCGWSLGCHCFEKTGHCWYVHYHLLTSIFCLLTCLLAYFSGCLPVCLHRFRRP